MKFTEEKRNKNMLIIFMFNDKDKYLGNYAIKKKEDVFIRFVPELSFHSG